MSVAVTKRPTILPTTTTDRRLPMATWNSFTELAGDVSAGSSIISVEWSNQSTAVFSVEEVYTNVSGAAADIVAFHFLNTKNITDDGDEFRFYSSVLLRNLVAAGIAASSRESATALRFRPNLGQWLLQSIAANPGAGQTHKMAAWGYVWDPEALNDIGGPIKPGEFLPPE